jgi:DNA-binding NarL/FixJ family response regulator
LSLPEGVWAIKCLAALDGANVVALAVPDLEADVLTCAEAGVSAYVTREQPISALTETILGVARGEAICSARMAATLLRRIATLAVERRPEPPDRRLTERELDVVGLIDQGLSNKLIAGRLCIEVSTVKNHVHSILEKLQVNRRGEAAARVRATTVLRATDDRGASRSSGSEGPDPRRGPG